MADYSRFKERKPEDTILEIQKILHGLGLFPVQVWSGGYKGAVSKRITLHPTSLGTNGKGSDEAYATASAYAEMMERMNNGFLTMCDKSDDMSGETGFREFPDEKLMTPAEILADPDPFTKRVLPLLGAKDYYSQLHFMNTIASMYGEGNRTIPCVPFADPEENRILYLPLQLVLLITGSNGMAAGNTLEEAMVQGLSEIFERAVAKELINEGRVPPEIPDSELEKYSFWPLVERIRQEGRYRVTFYDCSLGRHYPVAGICINDLDTGTFGMKLGAHPSFAVAVERTLTEAFQGARVEEFTANCRAVMPAQARSYHNYANFSKNGIGNCPTTLFTEEPDWEYHPWTRWEDKNNHEFLQGMLKMLRDEGYRPLLRDTSFLGFPSCFIVVPGFSEVWYTDEINRRHICTTAAVRKIWSHFPDLTDKEEDRLLRLIRFCDGSNLEEDIELISLRPLTGVFSSDKVAAWLSLKHDEFMQASYFFRKLLQTEESRVERIRMLAMVWYVEARASGLEKEKARTLIRKLFRKDVAEQVVRDSEDPAAAMKREFPPLKCFDCEHCPAAGKDCDYPAVREVLLRNAKGMKAENVSQEALLEELRAMYQA